MTSDQARTKPAEFRGRKNKLSSVQAVAYGALFLVCGNVLQQSKPKPFHKKTLRNIVCARTALKETLCPESDSILICSDLICVLSPKKVMFEKSWKVVLREKK